MVLAWENLQEVFVMLVVVVVFLTGGFYISGLLFLATGTPPWLLRPVKASTSAQLYPGYFRLFYFCQAFPSQFYRERYGSEWGIFTRRRFLPYAPSATFLARFCDHPCCDSDAGRNTPSRIFLWPCHHQVVPSSWRMDLNYSYCSYKTIDLSIAPVSHEV